MLCPKSRPAELETTLPTAATGDGTPDGGAPVPPSPDDEPEARSSLAVCPWTTGHPAARRRPSSTRPRSNQKAATHPTRHPRPIRHAGAVARRETTTERPAPAPAPATTPKHHSRPAGAPAAPHPPPTATTMPAHSHRPATTKHPARRAAPHPATAQPNRAKPVSLLAAHRPDESTPTAEQRSCHRSAPTQATQTREATRQQPTNREEASR